MSSMRSTDGREEYKELNPGQVTYYDGLIEVDLDKIQSHDRHAVPSQQYLHH